MSSMGFPHKMRVWALEKLEVANGALLSQGQEINYRNVHPTPFICTPIYDSRKRVRSRTNTHKLQYDRLLLLKVEAMAFSFTNGLLRNRATRI
eukprot:4983145-Amphidinium_carterae.2